MINIEPIIEKVKKSLDCHRTETGYARYPEKGDNEYGIADALNIMFTIDDIPKRSELDLLTERLKDFQSPETGLFALNCLIKNRKTAVFKKLYAFKIEVNSGVVTKSEL